MNSNLCDKNIMHKLRNSAEKPLHTYSRIQYLTAVIKNCLSVMPT